MLIDLSVVLSHTISAIVGGLLATVILQHKHLNNLTKLMVAKISAITNPVSEFRDIKSLARMLNETISSYDDDFERLKLCRALPCELSDALVDHCESNPNIVATTKRLLQTYHSLIDRIVKEGVGSYDQSLFGKISVSSVNAATWQQIAKTYFLGNSAPDTSEIGFHDNLDEYGVILFGDTEDKNSTVVSQWRVGYLLYFSRDFKTVRGFRYRRHSHIENLSLLFQGKKDDSLSIGAYHELNSSIAGNELAAIASSLGNPPGQ